jgi:hypothetical protein
MNRRNTRNTRRAKQRLRQIRKNLACGKHEGNPDSNMKKRREKSGMTQRKDANCTNGMRKTGRKVAQRGWPIREL